jgi:hypothetical protein
MAEALDGNVIDLEGNELVIVQLGHTDTDYTPCPVDWARGRR